MYIKIIKNVTFLQIYLAAYLITKYILCLIKFANSDKMLFINIKIRIHFPSGSYFKQYLWVTAILDFWSTKNELYKGTTVIHIKFESGEVAQFLMKKKKEDFVISFVQMWQPLIIEKKEHSS